jgi:hypothetical protein
VYQNIKFSRGFYTTILAIIAGMLVLSTSETMYAQPITPLIESTNSTYFTNIQWLIDENVLVFEEASIFGDIVDTQQVTQPQLLRQSIWYTYDPTETGENALTASSAIPAAFKFPVEELSLPIAAETDGDIGFTFPSPDGRFVVYAAQKPPEWEYMDYPLAIADLQTGQSTFIDGIVVQLHASTDGSYSIYWSANSRAFTVDSQPRGPVPRIFYVNNFTETLDALVATYLDSLSFNNQIIQPVEFHDISLDGSRLLLRVATEDGRRIFVWNTQSPTQSQFIAPESSVYTNAAAFSQNDEQKIVYIDENGLALYDLQTGRRTILDIDFHATILDRVWFSPDASDVALLHQGMSNYSLYVVDVPERSE